MTMLIVRSFHSACSFSLKDYFCSIGSPCILDSCWCFHSASIIAITALRGVLVKAILLVGSCIYRYPTSVLKRVRLALTSMILKKRKLVNPSRPFCASDILCLRMSGLFKFHSSPVPQSLNLVSLFHTWSLFFISSPSSS